MNPFNIISNLFCSFSSSGASTPLQAGPNALILLGYLIWNNSKSKRNQSQKSDILRKLSCQSCETVESQEVYENKSRIIPSFRESITHPILTSSRNQLLPDCGEVASQYEFVEAKKIRKRKKSSDGNVQRPTSKKGKTPSVKRLQNRYDLRKRR